MKNMVSKKTEVLKSKKRYKKKIDIKNPEKNKLKLYINLIQQKKSRKIEKYFFNRSKKKKDKNFQNFTNENFQLKIKKENFPLIKKEENFKDKILEENFNKDFEKKKIDENFQKKILKEFFNWSKDIDYAIDNNIEIIIGDKFVKKNNFLEIIKKKKYKKNKK